MCACNYVYIYIWMYGIPSPLSETCLEAPYWSGSFSHIPSLLLAPYPSAFVPQTLCKCSTYEPCHFNPEDGDSMFPRSAVIDLQAPRRPAPRQCQHYANRRENPISINEFLIRFLFYCKLTVLGNVCYQSSNGLV
jgi:hypothetical protein